MTQHDLDLLEKLVRMPDNEINLKDIPEVTGKFFARGSGVQTLFKPLKQQLTLRLDADVIAWAKRDGAGYQSRINAALRKAMLQEMKNS